MTIHGKWVMAATIWAFPAVAFGQGTAFTYQGQLKQSGSPAGGSFNMTFKLFDVVAPGGTQQGSTLTFDGVGGNPAPVSVANGLFTVQLDFGVGPYTANQARWLEIAVGGTTLLPRQPLTPAPFALNTRGVNVDSLGRVGVGTATPAQKLSVVGTVQSTSGGFMFPDNTVQTTASTGGPGFWTSSGSNIFSNNTGFVGIGTSAPQAKLDLRGNLILDTGTDAAIMTGTAGIEQNRYLSLFNSLAFTSASGLKAGGILCADSYFYANPGKNDLIVKGNVGIGVATPSAKLQVGGTGMPPFGVFCDSNSSDAGANAIRGTISNINFGGAFSCGVFGGNNANNGGFGVFGNHASAGVGVRGDSVGGVGVEGTSQSPSGFGVYGLASSATGSNYGVYGESYSTSGYGVIGYVSLSSGTTYGVFGHSHSPSGYGGYFVNSGGGVALKASGLAQVNTLQIMGGADLAEPFDVTGDDIKPGIVVVIDPAHPGGLKPCTKAYDRRVAGIISGAGGIATGLSMGHEGTIADGKHAVALSGRVYCLADAANGPIEPGEMLTTSAHTGHAMKAGDFDKARGAIIGKAMTALPSGNGLVLVLVNLQ